MNMKLLKIGNRLINLDQITSVSYEPEATNPGSPQYWVECVVSFSADDYTVFYNGEAEIVWAYLSSTLNCRSFVIQKDTKYPALLPEPSQA
jgi:hypothetical protein